MSFEPTSEQTILNTGASKMLATQALLTTVIAWTFYYYQGQLAGQAALFGGGIVMFNVFLTNRRIQVAAKIAKIAPGKEAKVFYITAIQRFIFTLGFFVLGMGWFELLPVPMLATFAIAHLGYLFNGHSN